MRGIRRLAVVVATGVVVAFVAGPASAVDTGAGGVVINGSPVGLVSYEGKVMTFAAYDVASTKASKAGLSPILLLDRTAVSRGYAVAYDNYAQANAYTTTHKMGTLPTADRDAAAERATTKRLPVANPVTPMSSAIGCGLPNHLGYLYVNASCGGNYLAVGWHDAVSELNSYGMNDVVSSMALGDCIGMLTAYVNADYKGKAFGFGGLDFYAGMPAGWNDVISSYKTTPSGLC